jgi:hypothetical protein
MALVYRKADDQMMKFADRTSFPRPLAGEALSVRHSILAHVVALSTGEENAAHIHT